MSSNVNATIKLIDLFRHENFNSNFGVEWIEINEMFYSRRSILEESNNEQENQDDSSRSNSTNQRALIVVKSVHNNNTRLPAHIWRSLAKIEIGDIVVELNGVSTAGQTLVEFEKNLKLSGNRIRLRLKSEPSGHSASVLDQTDFNSTWKSPANELLLMANGYKNCSSKSRSCENNLNQVDQDLTVSSSSLIDLPISSSNADYDNLHADQFENPCRNEDFHRNPANNSRLNNCNSSTFNGDFDEKIKREIDARLKALDDEFDFSAPVISETVNKSVDLPSAQRLAKRLHALDGFRSIDVMRHLCKRNDFNQLVAEEYVKLFNFQGDTLDRALRKFVKQFAIVGEAQDRERVLHFFAARYLDCNPTTFSSVDACHMLTCAIMLLNTDLHDSKITNKMTFQQFSDNLHGLNEGLDFSKDLLKSLYNAIKNEPLMDETTFGLEDYNDVRLAGHGTQNSHKTFNNPFLEIPDTSKSIEYMQGYVMRKCCVESDGKRTSFLRRGWKAYYANLRDMILYLHKSDEQPPNMSIGDTNAIRLHHALAQEAIDYRKRQHVFRLKTSDWAEYLFQTSDHELMIKWIEAINLVAASFSSPPLPAAIDSSSLRFQRPLLPSVRTRHSVFEQYDFILHEIGQITKQLDELRAQSFANNNLNGDMKNLKACDIIENKDKINYFQYELLRYETYADRLRRHFQQFALEQHSIKSSNLDSQQHNFLGPTEALPGVNNCHSTSSNHKKSSPTNTIALANANRYSYMMAVNTHPVAIKEHRL